MEEPRERQIIPTDFHQSFRKGSQESYLKKIKMDTVFEKAYTATVILLGLFFLLFLVSCSQEKETKKITKKANTTSSVMEMRKLEKLVPLDAGLASKYKRSCLTCHSNPDAMAPLVHDTQAWDKLIKEKGMDGLVKNVVNGYGNMPAGGQCADCSEEEMKKLVEFLAGIEH